MLSDQTIVVRITSSKGDPWTLVVLEDEAILRGPHVSGGASWTRGGREGEDLAPWLCGIDGHYASGRFLPHMPETSGFDGEATAAAVAEWWREHRDDLADIADEVGAFLARKTMLTFERFERVYDGHARYDFYRERDNPRLKEFRDEVWPALVEALKAEIRVESDLQAVNACEMAAASLQFQRDLCEALGLPEGTHPEEIVRVAQRLADPIGKERRERFEEMRRKHDRAVKRVEKMLGVDHG